ncbi:zinc finger protein OZF-like [Diabrotica virgifera virgifera]|uniref:Uncharacterized protein n=1 Tax=Diabrotica virgifera virgifera TaxID=50390 RepID=A0ABM5L3K7_DIAVI|nr:zinc finger protein OZF-like [Diabrotica virgifera virgifera]
MSNTSIDFTKCRICLEIRNPMESFFNIYYEELSLAQIFNNISKYDVQEHNYLPKYICITCKTSIIGFYNLISTFEQTEKYINNLYHSGKILEENTSIRDIKQEQTILRVDQWIGDNQNDDSASCYDDDDPDPDGFKENFNIVKDELNVQFSEIKPKESFESFTKNNEYKNVKTEKFSCECGDTYLHKVGFRHHMQQKHNMQLEEDDFEKYAEPITLTIPTGYSDDVEYVFPKQLLKRDRLECRICQMKFEKKAEVKAHEAVHKTHICDQCGAAFLKKTYLQDHQITHSEVRRYRCKQCGKAFKHRHTLSVHKKTHEESKSYVCEVCGIGFKARATLYTHTLLKHSDEKKFPCSSCHLRFNLKSSRDKHYIRKHTLNREKSFVCSKCGAAYLNKTSLTKHNADKHLGQAKFYPCNICENKTYVMKKGLKIHMMKKHNHEIV